MENERIITPELLRVYLNQQIKSVKERLGKECSFLAFEQVKSLYFFKAKMGNDRVRVQINTPLENVGQAEFEDLFKILNTKSYVGENTV